MLAFLKRLKRTSVLSTVKRAAVMPLSRALRKRRIGTLENQWHAASTARDTVFVARTQSRYRAHQRCDAEPALLPARNPVSLPAETWEALYQPRRSPKREAEIDIILPVTHGYDITLPALYELLTSNNATPFRVVALLSQHPDHKLTDKLRRLQELDLFDLLVDNGNEGMIGLVNFALQRHDTRDIVLLNNHIECADGWLDRLREAAGQRPATTATVSPWLTSGGPTGYPDAEGSIAHALEPTMLLDSICQNLFGAASLEPLTSPATDALYIRRDALHALGLLPERAHTLTTAIQAWAATAEEKGYEHIWAKHVMLGTSAGYLPANQNGAASYSEIAPLIDTARITHQSTGHRLIIEGVRSKADPVSQGVVHITPDPADVARLRLGMPYIRLFPHLSFALDSGFDDLTELCHALGITTLLLRQPAGFPSRMLEWLMLFSQRSGIPYQLEINDDYLICPGLLGIDKTCAPEDLESCYRSFTDTHPLDTDGMPLWLWRVRSATLLEHASAIHFSDDHLRALFSRYFAIP